MKFAGEQELRCVECERTALGSDPASWRAYLTIDDEVVICSERCAEREFGEGALDCE